MFRSRYFQSGIGLLERQHEPDNAEGSFFIASFLKEKVLLLPLLFLLPFLLMLLLVLVLMLLLLLLLLLLCYRCLYAAVDLLRLPLRSLLWVICLL